MYNRDGRRAPGQGRADSASPDAPVPGKRTQVELLQARSGGAGTGPTVRAGFDPGYSAAGQVGMHGPGPAGGTPGKRTLTESLVPVGRARDRVQQLDRGARPPGPPETTSPGAPIPEGVRNPLERSFEQDFSSVTVHEGPEATSMGALAFTRGEQIHFAPGQYAPATTAGRELLGHELAHVVQQRGGTATPSGATALAPDASGEAEADRAAAAALCGDRAMVSQGNAPAVQYRLATGVIQGVQQPSVALALNTHGLTTQLQSILDELEKYVNLSVGDQDDRPALPILELIVKGTRHCEAALIRLREQLDPLQAEYAELGAAKAELVKLADAAGNDVREIRKRIRTEEYNEMEPQTLRDIEDDIAHHLLISPHPSSGSSGATGEQYPPEVPLDKRYTLALPPSSEGTTSQFQPTIVGNGRRILDVLVIGGGHGGMGQLFEQDTSGQTFSSDYWTTNVVGPLVQSGVRARFIVLDACLTGSMIPVFAPLLVDNGQIICSMTSAPRTVVTPETWVQLIQAIETQEKNGVARVLAESARTVQSEMPCGVFGVFDGESKTLTYDQHLGEPDPGLDEFAGPERRDDVAEIDESMQQSGYQTRTRSNLDYSSVIGPQDRPPATRSEPPRSRAFLFMMLGILLVITLGGAFLFFL